MIARPGDKVRARVEYRDRMQVGFAPDVFQKCPVAGRASVELPVGDPGDRYSPLVDQGLETPIEGRLQAGLASAPEAVPVAGHEREARGTQNPARDPGQKDKGGGERPGIATGPAREHPEHARNTRQRTHQQPSGRGPARPYRQRPHAQPEQRAHGGLS